MATRFRKIRTRSTKKHGRKGLKTRKMRGGDMGSMLSKFKGALGMPTLTKNQKSMMNEEKKQKRVSEIEETIQNRKNKMAEVNILLRRARGAPSAPAFQSRKQGLQNNINKAKRELRNIMPNHSLVQNMNNNA